MPATISIVVPAYCEEDNLPRLYERITAVFAELPETLELLVIDDGSTDGTLAWLQAKAKDDERLRYVSFSRNFGHQAGVSAGMAHARGDAIVVIDADLQDPPELIAEMLKLWREGVHIVVPQRRSRNDKGVKRMLAWGYYRLLRRLSEVDVPVDAGDFCLMDRRVVDAMNALPERHRYVRGLRAWVGFTSAEVPFDRSARHAGEPKYTFFKSLVLAMNGIMSLSTSPLRLATFLGLGTGLLALLMIALMVYWRFFTAAPLEGYFTIISIILLMGSVQLLVCGIMGEYLGRIYGEVKARPLYVVGETNAEEQCPPRGPHS